MARKAIKALKDTTKVLGGLGAAYVLSDMLGPKVTGVDPEVEAADREKRRKDAEKYLVNKPPESVESSTARPPEAPITSRVVIPPELEKRTIRHDSNPFKKGGAVKASRRADGIAQRGKTRGKMV